MEISFIILYHPQKLIGNKEVGGESWNSSDEFSK